MSRFNSLIVGAVALLLSMPSGALAFATTAQVQVQTDPQILVPHCRAFNGFIYQGVTIDLRAVGVIGPLPSGSQYAGEMACIYHGIGSAPWWSATACDNADVRYETVSMGGVQYCAWPHDGQVLVTPINVTGAPFPPAEAEFPMPLYWQVNPPAAPNACVDDANFVQIVGDWLGRTVCEVNSPAIPLDDCPVETPPHFGRPLVFPADFDNPQSNDPSGTRFCVYPPHGAHYGDPHRFWYITGWRAVRIIGEPTTTEPSITTARDPDFPSANWSVDHCPNVDVGRGRSTYAAGQTVTDGNPPPGYAVSYEYNLRIALCHIYQGGVVALEDYEVDRLDFAFDVIPTHRSGRMAISALVVQDGVAYWAQPLALAGGSPIGYSRALSESDFTPVFSATSSPQHPDFGCDGPPFRVGFGTFNQTGSGSTPTTFMNQRSVVVDNWSFATTPGAECD